jgi:formyltetrahydrofolate synthetase
VKLAEGATARPIVALADELGLEPDEVALGPVFGIKSGGTGAGCIVALCGEMQTMAGLPSKPAALGIELEGGRIRGLR